MKLAGQPAARFCAKPDPALVGALLHGPDAGLLALRRGELVARLIEGDDLRLTRLAGAEALKDPALIDDALRARGFFPGRRAVLVEGAKDGLAKPLAEVLTGIDREDAFLVVEAPGLGGRSPLRRLFESDRRLVALGLYPEPAGAEELRALLGQAGLTVGLEPEAEAELVAAAQDLDAGAVRQLVGTIALYGLEHDRPLDRDEVAGLLPLAGDSGLDRLVAAVAEGRVAEVGPLIARLSASGITPAGVLIATGRHFRQLLGVAVAGRSAEEAIQRIRPPLYGPRRDALLRQARAWGAPRLERAVRLVFEADRTLRSPGQRPDRAMAERTLIRLAMMATG